MTGRIDGGSYIPSTPQLGGLAGSGNVGNSTQLGAGDFVPDLRSAAAALGLNLPAQMSNDDLIVLMQTLKSKVEDSQLKTSSIDIQNQKEMKKAAADERIDQLMEAIKKGDEGKKSGEIGKIFGWIAAAAMVIAGAVLLATGVGTAAGVGLLVGGVAMLATMTLQETGGMEKMLDGMTKGLMSTFGMSEKDARIFATAIVAVAVIAVAVAAGVAGGPAVGVMVGAQFMSMLFTPDNLEKMGVDKDKAPWASMGISIALALTSLSVGVGTTVAASKGVEIAGKLTPKLAEYGAKFAGTIAEKAGTSVQQVQKMAQVISYVTQGIQAGVAGAGAGVGIKGAIANRDAGEAEAKSKEIEADLLKLQQMLQDETDRIDEIIKRLQEGNSIVMDVLNQSADVQSRVAAV